MQGKRRRKARKEGMQAQITRLHTSIVDQFSSGGKITSKMVSSGVCSKPKDQEQTMRTFLHVISVLVFCKNVTRIILMTQTLDKEDINSARSSKNHEQLTINLWRT